MKIQKSKSISLYNIILILLVVMNEITTIYVFSNIPELDRAINFLQLFLYIGLIYIVIKKKYTLKKLLLFCIIGGLLLIGYISSGQAAFFKGFLLIIAASNVPYKKILRTCRMATMFIVILSILLWLMGISDSGIGRRDAIAIGFVHPNVAAQMIMLVCLLWASEMSEKIKYRDYFVIELVGVLIFFITDSRTSTIVVVLLPFLLEFNKRILKYRQVGKIPAFLLTYSQLLITIFAYVTARFLEDNSFFQSLNLILSSRLFLNYYVLNQYGVKLFGQNVTLQDYSGKIYNNIQNLYNWNITCDCSYMFSLIVMGLIPTIIVLIGFIILMRKAIKNKNYMVISIAVVLAMYAFTESQMLEVYRNFVYFYILALDQNEGIRKTLHWKEKVEIQKKH